MEEEKGEVGMGEREGKRREGKEIDPVFISKNRRLGLYDTIRDAILTCARKPT